MKLRPFLILLLFAASAAILVWIYATASDERPQSQPNPWAATLGDLDACCRRKHVKSAQYDHFATIASDEQQRSAAHLFRAMALAERIQENNCAAAIIHLGGSYTPPVKVVVFRGATSNNLERSIAFERRSLDELQGADIDRAMAAQNRYAARALIWAAAGDLKHLIFMQQLRAELPHNLADGFEVCPVCGNLYIETQRDRYCPHCLTDGRRFIQVE